MIYILLCASRSVQKKLYRPCLGHSGLACNPQVDRWGRALLERTVADRDCRLSYPNEAIASSTALSIVKTNGTTEAKLRMNCEPNSPRSEAFSTATSRI